MDVVVSTFPLLHLPNKAMLNIFRIMDLLQIFGISLLSRKIKNSVKTLKMTATDFQVDISDRFQVYLGVTNYSPLTFRLYQVLENEPLQKLGTPADSRFSRQSVHENVKDIKSIGFLSGNHEHNKMILSFFQPAHIALFAQALVNFSAPRYILPQNFDVIHVLDAQIALDDLLVTNTRFIDLRSGVSMKTLNQFLKLWMKGSNSRLECFLVVFHGDFQIEELLSGMNYQKAPEGVRRFKTVGVQSPVGIRNGRDIWRIDGRKATILVGMRGGLVKFGFYVWHEHCDLN